MRPRRLRELYTRDPEEAFGIVMGLPPEDVLRLMTVILQEERKAMERAKTDLAGTPDREIARLRFRMHREILIRAAANSVQGSARACARDLERIGFRGPDLHRGAWATGLFLRLFQRIALAPTLVGIVVLCLVLVMLGRPMTEVVAAGVGLPALVLGLWVFNFRRPFREFVRGLRHPHLITRKAVCMALVMGLSDGKTRWSDLASAVSDGFERGR